MIIFIVLYAVLLLGMGGFFFAMLGSLGSGAPFVPTGGAAMRAIFKQWPMRSGEVFYELGSGDGRVARLAAAQGARAVGFERSRILVLWSRLVSWVNQDLTRYVRGNFLSADLSAADTVFCYLFPHLMSKLVPKFEKELRPGTRIISRAFKLPGWTPVERLQFSHRSPPVYLYLVK